MYQYCFIYNNKYIGIDQSSGGYPWETDNPLQVHMFNSIEEALKYKNIVAKDKDWKLMRFHGLDLGPVYD